jgi:hypothetical protein
MDFLKLAKDYIKTIPLAIPYIVLKYFFIKNGKFQSNESEIIDRLVNKFNPPKLFVGFGFFEWI